MYTSPFTSMTHASAAKTMPRSLGAKRALDVSLTLFGLLAILPMLLVIALAVKVSSPGSVFFVQNRVGKNGKLFGMVKFRSMYIDAEARRAALGTQSDRAGICFKIKNDPRITPVGRILRRFSMDELPQLFNILRGDMSLVGPRPALPEEVARYPHHAFERLRVLPGITGSWQVSGRADLSFNQMIQLDLDYARNSTLATDLTILRRTVDAVISGRGAY